MVVELLSEEALRAEVPWLYRHNLESFTWVLLYASACVKDGKENLDVEPFRDWISKGPSQLRRHKMEFVQNSRRLSNNFPNKEWLILTFRIWFDIIFAYNVEDVPGPEHDPELLSNILRVWKIEKEECKDFT